MALESTTYIDGLVVTNPTGTDPRSQGDDHIRLVKATIRSTFPNVSGAMTATHTELNLIDGYTGTTAELNYNDVPTLGTVEASRTVTADAVGTTTNLKTKKQTEIVNVVGTVSGATAINFALGNVATAVLASGGSFTISNAPTSGIYGKFKLILTNGGTVADPWHASVKFAGGTTPTLTTSGVDILTFETIDNGATWFAVVEGLDMK
jgi:hypothetical protein